MFQLIVKKYYLELYGMPIEILLKASKILEEMGKVQVIIMIMKFLLVIFLRFMN